MGAAGVMLKLVVCREFVKRVTGELRAIVCDENVRYAMSSEMRLEAFDDLWTCGLFQVVNLDKIGVIVHQDEIVLPT